MKVIDAVLFRRRADCPPEKPVSMVTHDSVFGHSDTTRPSRSRVNLGRRATA